MSSPRRAEEEVRAAIAFLTRIRVARTMPELTGAAAFGLVGALIGLLAGLPMIAVGQAAPLAAGALSVGVIALLSGALHLDGLGDTFDALAAPSAAADDARRDPRLGSAGVVAVGTVLIAEAALLGQLASTAGVLVAALACAVAAGISRACAVVTAWLQRSLTRPGGASWFASGLTPVSVMLSAGTAALAGMGASLLAGTPALVIGAAGGLAVALAASVSIVRARHGLDGDGIGASVELAFAAVLLVTVLVA